MNIEEALDTLHGDREEFRRVLQPEAILARVCRIAELRAIGKRVDPWSEIGAMTGHGSGVSNAIFNLYQTHRKDKP